MRLGYARVSTQDQDTAAQLTALKAADCDRLFQEKASGGRWDRPQLQKLLGQLRSDDVVVVWKLDRLSRSLKDLLLVLEKIDQAGAHFQSLTEAIDTTTSAGRMMMHMVGSFAEFERSLLRERTRVGLDEARKAGRVGGRRPKLTKAQQQEVIDLVGSGKKSAADVARLFQVHAATVSRVLAQHRAEQLAMAPAPKPKPPVRKKKSVAKKASSRKRAAKKKAEAPVDTIMDAIGLARPVSFKDFPGAVSVMAEAKTLPVGDRLQWKASPRRYMAVWEAEKHLQRFRQKHREATVEQRYKVKDKTILELSATYDDERADHRVVYQARNR